MTAIIAPAANPAAGNRAVITRTNPNPIAVATGSGRPPERIDAQGYYSLFTEHVPEEFDAEVITENGEAASPEAAEVNQPDHDHS